MNIIIGKEENALFEKGAIYDCVIKGEINEQLIIKYMVMSSLYLVQKKNSIKIFDYQT